jgi:hypothetical protein
MLSTETETDIIRTLKDLTDRALEMKLEGDREDEAADKLDQVAALLCLWKRTEAAYQQLDVLGDSYLKLLKAGKAVRTLLEKQGIDSLRSNPYQEWVKLLDNPEQETSEDV